MIAFDIAAELAAEIKEQVQEQRDLSKVELAMRQIINELAAQALSLFSHQLLEEQQPPLCERCNKPMTRKRTTTTTLRTTFGEIHNTVADYHCKPCKRKHRLRAYKVPPVGKARPVWVRRGDEVHPGYRAHRAFPRR